MTRRPDRPRPDRPRPDGLGGKGTHLLRLQESGFDVPSWFCVLAPALGETLRANGSLEAVQRRLEALGEASRTEVDMASTELRALVEGMRLPASVRDPLAEGFRRVAGDGAVAVRSSTEGEDGVKSSAAGLYESVLGIAGEDELFDALRTVWASYFSPRALLLGRERPEPPDLRIAVVVQRMVHAASSGVLFTANPVNHDFDETVIQSTFGLGEGLVDGRMAGDAFQVSRSDASVEPHLSYKARKVVVQEGRLREVEVPLELRETPSLTDAQVHEIARLGAAVETAFHRPQDIEFAVDGAGKTWLLQTRPITTLPEYGPAAGNPKSWSVENWAENYPGITLPMTYSVVRRMDRIGLSALARFLGVPETEIRRNPQVFGGFLGYINGALVSDGLAGRKLVRLIPGSRFQPALILRLFGADPRKVGDLLPGVSPRRRWLREFPAVLRLAGRILRTFRRIGPEVDDLLEDARTFHGQVKEIHLEDTPPANLLELVEEAEMRFVGRWHLAMLNGIFLKACHAGLRWMCRAWIKDRSGSLHNRLLLGGVTEQRVSLAEFEALGESARCNDRLRSQLLDDDLSELVQDVAFDPDLATFREQVDSFLFRYPFKGRNEMKLEGETYRHNPVLLFKTLREVVRGQIRQAENEGRQPPQEPVAQREAAERETVSGLGKKPLGWWRRRLFRWMLAKTRGLDERREAIKFLRLRLVGDYRELLRAVGGHLVQEGLLDRREDLFFLGLEELLDFVRGNALSPDLRPLVAARQAHISTLRSGETPRPADAFKTYGIVYHKNEYGSSRAPRTEAGASSEDVSIPGPFRGRPPTLQGIGCSGGLAEGEVVVAESPEAVESVAGRILVVPRIHSDWVPYFPSLAGLLVEQGEILAHAMTVAREVGLHTVSGIPNLRAHLKDGQTVSLDGNRGLVTLLPSEAEEPAAQAVAKTA